jgi:hypothetical protein
MTHAPEAPATRAHWLSDTIIAVTLAAIAATVWWSWTYQLDLVTALKGFAPVGWVYKFLAPSAFALDFPGGTENYRRSAFMHVYVIANALGVPPEALLPVIIALEIVLLAWAMWALSRQLVPDAPRIVPALVVVLAIATPARDVNLAYFSQPYFIGQYYNIADVLRIFALIMVLRCRPVSAAVLFAGSFVTHPILGLMGLACGAAMQLARPREIRHTRYLVGVFAFCAIAGAWLLLQFRSATITGGQIPVSTWLDLTRMFSTHWYPLENNLRSTTGLWGGQWVVVPFIAFLLLLAFYWPVRDGRQDVSDKTRNGVITMLALALAGLAISVTVPVPLLIKLAFQRSNDLVVILGLPYVVAGLWRDIRAASWWRCALATILLAALSRGRPVSFIPWPIDVPVFPLAWWVVLPIALTAPEWLRALKRDSATGRTWIIVVLAIAAIVMGGIYLGSGIAEDAKPVLGGGRAVMLFAGVAIVALALVRLDRRPVLQWLAAGLVAALAFVGLKERADAKIDVALASDYMRVQLWAREHTPVDALFMPDPTIYYGWRDYSRRSSFGNLREWLFTSWLYDSDMARYTEGLRRFSEFGIDPRPMLAARPPLTGFARLNKAVKERYYRASDEWRLGLARRYDVDYFVFVRRDVIQPSRLPIAYENEHFVVHAATAQ